MSSALCDLPIWVQCDLTAGVDPTRTQGARGICRLVTVSGGVGGVVKRPVTGRSITCKGWPGQQLRIGRRKKAHRFLG